MRRASLFGLPLETPGLCRASGFRFFRPLHEAQRGLMIGVKYGEMIAGFFGCVSVSVRRSRLAPFGRPSRAVLRTSRAAPPQALHSARILVLRTSNTFALIVCLSSWHAAETRAGQHLARERESSTPPPAGAADAFLALARHVALTRDTGRAGGGFFPRSEGRGVGVQSGPRYTAVDNHHSGGQQGLPLRRPKPEHASRFPDRVELVDLRQPEGLRLSDR